MSGAVVIGYASMDYPATLNGHVEANRTVMIRRRPSDAFPRPGGCALYAARPLAAKGIPVSVLSWVGADDHGKLFSSSAEWDGIDTRGILAVESGATPVTFMIYQADGSCACLFDPGISGREFLSGEQSELIVRAELFCVAVAPPAIVEQALALIGGNCKLAWIMKKDPLSFPEPLRIKLASRADYIFCNRRERDWVDGALAKSASDRRPLVVETAGGEAVRAEAGGQAVRIGVEPLRCDDPTGAGDTLAGGCLAAILAGERELESVVSSGIGAAAALLRGRRSG